MGDAAAEPVRISTPEKAAGPKTSILRRPVGPGMILAIIVGVVVVRGWLIEGVIVEGNSMYPTLRDGERLLLQKKRYSPKELPARGDIVILQDPQTHGIAVKRVIALPGEFVAVVGLRVLLGGKTLEEPYAHGRKPFFPPIGGVLPETAVWVMGDNRDHSADSRVYGPVSLANLRGRALLVLWPPLPRPVPRAKYQ